MTTVKTILQMTRATVVIKPPNGIKLGVGISEKPYCNTANRSLQGKPKVEMNNEGPIGAKSLREHQHMWT